MIQIGFAECRHHAGDGLLHLMLVGIALADNNFRQAVGREQHAYWSVGVGARLIQRIAHQCRGGRDIAGIGVEAAQRGHAFG